MKKNRVRFPIPEIRDEETLYKIVSSFLTDKYKNAKKEENALNYLEAAHYIILCSPAEICTGR